MKAHPCIVSQVSNIQRYLGQLPRKWRSSPRRWGHSLHAMCSYMAMFPPAIPHTFIRWLTSPGDAVYDPFCGRGTTPLEAELLGRIGLGSDANPLACAIAKAKVELPQWSSLSRRLADLSENMKSVDVSDQPEHIKMLFHPSTLSQLVWLRSTLSPQRKADAFIIGTILGILHRNADSSGEPLGLTVAMPNTFSMSPLYIERYITQKQLKPPIADVITLVERRIQNFSFPRLSPGRKIWRHDITQPVRWRSSRPTPRLIFTSPPYLQVILYGKFNWIRLWFLGHKSKAVDQCLFTSSSLQKYSTFMNKSLVHMRSCLRDDGYICLVIGDVQDRYHQENINLAQFVADNSLDDTGLQVIGIVTDKIPVKHKVSRIWKNTRGNATKTDRILILGTANAPLPPHPPKINWS